MALATRNAEHLAEDCRDDNCPRFPCRLYKEGYRRGWEEGYEVGYAEGYAAGYGAGYSAGFSAGLASCSCGGGG